MLRTGIRYLDKLVDELAKGKKMEKILRGECRASFPICCLSKPPI